MNKKQEHPNLVTLSVLSRRICELCHLETIELGACQDQTTVDVAVEILADLYHAERVRF